MTVIDDRETQSPDQTAQGAESTPATPVGAYSAEVLRVVRGTPNAEELAALVAALLLTRRAHERDEASGHCAPTAPSAPPDRPAWLRGPYSAPGSWAAGP